MMSGAADDRDAHLPARAAPAGVGETEPQIAVKPATKSDKPGLKFVIEMAPVAVWFIAFRLFGIVPATAILVAGTLLSLVAARVLLGKISPMLWVTAVLVTVFGGLTVGLNEPRFIKIKPTVVNLLFAGALGFGLFNGKNYLKMMFGEAFKLTPQGWRLLTIRWIGLFVALAVANEIIWRAYNTPETEYIWGYFKFLGIPLATIFFTIANLPLLTRYNAAQPEAN